MLVLTRRLNEGVLVGNALVKVIRISGDRVRIGVVADDSVPVIREELLKTAEGRAKVQAKPMQDLDKLDRRRLASAIRDMAAEYKDCYEETYMRVAFERAANFIENDVASRQAARNPPG